MGLLADGSRHEKLSKAEAGYVDQPGSQCPCFMCLAFDPHMLTCAKVEGGVLPRATCNEAATQVAVVIEPQDDVEPRITVPQWGGRNW